MDGAQDVLRILDSFGVLGALVLAFIGGMRKWYVWHWQYREVVRDRDFWRDTALRALNVGEAVIGRSRRQDED